MLKKIRGANIFEKTVKQSQVTIATKKMSQINSMPNRKKIFCFK
jgi:hypothetical protein